MFALYLLEIAILVITLIDDGVYTNARPKYFFYHGLLVYHVQQHKKMLLEIQHQLKHIILSAIKLLS